jgi:FkbM family methyltransferase
MKPVRLAAAQKICRVLPPIISQRMRSWIYSHRLAQRDAFECVVQAQTGSMLKGSTEDFHFYPFSVHGFYDFRNVTVALALASRGDIIIEVGANVGTESVCFADIIGPEGVAHAFEPLPSNIARLQKANDLSKHRNIRVHPCALSNKDTRTHFVVPPVTASGIGHIAQEGETFGQTIEIQVMRLDSLKQEIGQAKLIFVDIEGEEVKFLEGARKYLQDFRPALVLEASPQLLKRAGSSVHALFQTVAGYGYGIYRIGRLGLHQAEPDEQSRAANWVCLSENREVLATRISQWILRCATLPCVSGLNPLSRG